MGEVEGVCERERGGCVCGVCGCVGESAFLWERMGEREGGEGREGGGVEVSERRSTLQRLCCLAHGFLHNGASLQRGTMAGSTRAANEAWQDTPPNHNLMYGTLVLEGTETDKQVLYPRSLQARIQNRVAA